jgi:hypothetical protein
MQMGRLYEMALENQSVTTEVADSTIIRRVNGCRRMTVNATARFIPLQHVCQDVSNASKYAANIFRKNYISAQQIRSIRHFNNLSNEESKTNWMLHNGLLNLMNRSTCFGHYYAHHQELAAMQTAPACGTSLWLWQVAGLVHGCRFERPSISRDVARRGRSNLQPCTRPATCHNQCEVPHAGAVCIAASS